MRKQNTKNVISSLARKSIVSATSSALPILPRGVPSQKIFLSFSETVLFISVSINPGETQFTFIPDGPSSLATDFVNAIIAPFDAL